MISPAPGGVELILGSSIDDQFGPVILFGAGGRHVEAIGDRALGLPPLDITQARRLMEQTRVHKILKSARCLKPEGLVELEQALVRFSQLIVDQHWISEIDVNPVVASREGLVALDARILIHPASTREEELPRPAILAPA
jgi:acetyltransferase